MPPSLPPADHNDGRRSKSSATSTGAPDDSNSVSPSAAAPAASTFGGSGFDDTPPPPGPVAGNQSDGPATSQAPPPPTIPGYDVFGELGRGGMGVVYRARHLKLNRDVAVKLVAGGAAHSAAVIERFQVEAQAAAQLQHPNILQVFDLGVSNGQPYFSMELAEEGDLADRIGRQRPSPREAAEMVRQLAAAVHYAHEQGIIHRDLKPANVLITAGGELKISDFGLAKRLLDDVTLTATGAVLGTPAYMSPEQASGAGEKVAAATDIHALGVILYEVLTGSRPFAGSSHEEVRSQVIHEPPTPPSRHGRVPRDLETIVLKCLEKEPAARYASAAALADDLARYLAGEPIAARRTSVWRRSSRWLLKRPAWIAAAALVTVVLGAATSGLAYHLNYQRPYVAYYAAPIFRWDVWQGVHRLTRSEVGKRYMSFRVTRRGWRGPVLKTEVINGRGFLHPSSNIRGTITPDSQAGTLQPNLSTGETARHYLYDERGRTAEESAVNSTGDRLWSFAFIRKASADDLTAIGSFRTSDGYPRSGGRSGVQVLKIEFDERGYHRREAYTDVNGEPRPANDGTYGWAFQADDLGRVTHRTCLDKDGRPAMHSDLYVTERQTYDDRGNAVLVEYLDADGQPTVNRYGFSKSRGDFDAVGNMVRQTFLDANDRPTNTTAGCAIMRFTYDPNTGDRTEIAYFDEQDQPTLHVAGIWRWTAEYNESGLISRIVSYDVGNRVVANRLGEVEIRRSYYPDGRLKEESYYDAQGHPTTRSDGSHRNIGLFDLDDRRYERRSYDVAGRLVNHRQGYAQHQQGYDDSFNIVWQWYLDPDGKRTLSVDGYAGVRSEFDSRGNETKRTFLGLDGQPRITSLGYATVEGRFDDQGLVTDRWYRDETGELVLVGGNQLFSGYAHQHMQYDSARNLVSLKNFDQDDEPVKFFEHVYHHDERRNVVEESIRDKDGELIASYRVQAGQTTPLESARVVRSFDRLGRLLTEHHYRPDDSWDSGYRYEYDRRGNRLMTETIDRSGRPVAGPLGYATHRGRVDNRGLFVEQSYLDVQGNLVANGQGTFKQTTRYNAVGQAVEQWYWSGPGAGALRVEQTFNRVGLYTEQTIYRVPSDTQGKRPGKATGTPVSRLQRTYDDRGRILTQTGYGIQLAPLETPYFRATLTYGSGRNPTSARFTSPDGKLVDTPQGYASWRAEFDAAGRQLNRTYFDRHGKTVATMPVVLSITAGSQAERLDIKLGDAIVRYNGEPVGDEASLRAIRGRERSKATRKLEIDRDGKSITLEVRPGLLGVVLQDMTAEALAAHRTAQTDSPAGRPLK